MKLFWSSALMVALSFASGVALAAPEATPDATALEEAKSLYDQANARLEANDVTTALDLFRRSKAIVPSVYNVQGGAYCLYRLGRYDEAFEEYQELGGAYRAELGDEASRALDQRIEELRQRTGALAIAGPAGAVLFVDGRKRGVLPREQPIVVLPGDHSIRVVLGGDRTLLEKNISVRAGATLVVQVEATKRPRVAPPNPKRTEPRASPVPERPMSVQRTLGWSAVGLGVVGVGVGSYFGLRAVSKKQESDDSLEDGDCFAACHEAWEDGRSAARVSNVAFGVGAVGLIAGTYLLITADDSVSTGAAGPFSLGWTRKW